MTSIQRLSDAEVTEQIKNLRSRSIQVARACKLGCPLSEPEDIVGEATLYFYDEKRSKNLVFENYEQISEKYREFLIQAIDRAKKRSSKEYQYRKMAPAMDSLKYIQNTDSGQLSFIEIEVADPTANTQIEAEINMLYEEPNFKRLQELDSLDTKGMSRNAQQSRIREMHNKAMQIAKDLNIPYPKRNRKKTDSASKICSDEAEEADSEQFVP